MSWLYLFSGIFINVAGFLTIKFGVVSSKLFVTNIGYACYFVGFIFISLAVKRLEAGLTYALWSGIGTLLIVGIGALFFKESMNPVKMASFALVLVGVLGISLSS